MPFSTISELTALRSPVFQSALTLLLRATHYAHDLDADPWQFAVEIAELRATGLTGADLRWLALKGYIEHAEECSVREKQHRHFRSHGKHFLTERSCFILTDTGRNLVSSGSTPPSRDPELSRPTPRYYPDLKELWLNGELMKRFRVPAKNQELILTAFEEEGWPTHIDDPLPPEQEVAPIKRLQDATRRLNQNIRGNLRFLGNGSGSGVRWELTQK